MGGFAWGVVGEGEFVKSERQGKACGLVVEVVAGGSSGRGAEVDWLLVVAGD